MAIINPMAVYAKADAGITAQQLSDLLSGTQEMIENLQESDFTMVDIVDICFVGKCRGAGLAVTL